MTEAGFIGKIDGPFIFLTAAMLCHSLRCWRTGIFIDKVAFTRSNAGGKIKGADLWFLGVSGSLSVKASEYPRKPQVLEMGDMLANRKAGLLEHQKQTWQNTGERVKALIITWIKTTLEAKIAQERGKHVERTAGYSNVDDALRREFGIDLETEVSELAQGGLADPEENLGGLVEATLFREPPVGEEQIEESDREDMEDYVITTTL